MANRVEFQGFKDTKFREPVIIPEGVVPGTGLPQLRQAIEGLQAEMSKRSTGHIIEPTIGKAIGTLGIVKGVLDLAAKTGADGLQVTALNQNDSVAFSISGPALAEGQKFGTILRRTLGLTSVGTSLNFTVPQQNHGLGTIANKLEGAVAKAA
jgi:hypothetical protein